MSNCKSYREHPHYEAFLVENFLSPKTAQKLTFFVGLGGEIFKFTDENPLGNQSPLKHVVWRKKRRLYSQKCVLHSLARNQKLKKIKIKSLWTPYFTPLPERPCGADFYDFWRLGSHHRRNHSYQISCRLHEGLGARGAQNPVFPIDFHHRPYDSVTHYRATLWWDNKTESSRK